MLIPQDDEQHEETQEVRLNLGWMFPVMEKLTKPLFLEKNPGQKVLIMSAILCKVNSSFQFLEKVGSLHFPHRRLTYFFPVLLILHAVGLENYGKTDQLAFSTG